MEEVKHILEEMRDMQREHLAEFKRITDYTVGLQEQAVKRQEQAVRLYKFALIFGGVIVVVILVLIAYLMSYFF